MRADLRRLREQLSALMPPPPEPPREPPPEWFTRWVQALAAEVYAQAGLSRDAAQLHPFDISMRSLHSIFTNAHWYFRRHLNREPSEEEWCRWLEIAEEAAGRPDTGEALRLQKVWLRYHARLWQQPERNQDVFAE